MEDGNKTYGKVMNFFFKEPKRWGFNTNTIYSRKLEILGYIIGMNLLKDGTLEGQTDIEISETEKSCIYGRKTIETITITESVKEE